MLQERVISQLTRLQTVHSASPQTLAADRSVYALWALATGCHKIDYYITMQSPTELGCRTWICGMSTPRNVTDAL